MEEVIMILEVKEIFYEKYEEQENKYKYELEKVLCRAEFIGSKVNLSEFCKKSEESIAEIYVEEGEFLVELSPKNESLRELLKEGLSIGKKFKLIFKLKEDKYSLEQIIFC